MTSPRAGLDVASGDSLNSKGTPYIDAIGTSKLHARVTP
jgi:hypothetical protein